jgi:RNA recognition motif-containing protein
LILDALFEIFSLHVQIIKQKNGKSRAFAFVTMTSPEEAHAAIEKFNSYVSITLDNSTFLRENFDNCFQLENFVEKGPTWQGIAGEAPPIELPRGSISHTVNKISDIIV